MLFLLALEFGLDADPKRAMEETLGFVHAQATALVTGARSRTYAELYDRASRIATVLRRRGIGVEDPVAVVRRRGRELRRGRRRRGTRAAHP